MTFGSWRVTDARVEDAAVIARIKVAGWRFAYRGLMPDAVLDGLDEQDHAEGWRRRITALADPLGTPRLAVDEAGEVGGVAVADRVPVGGDEESAAEDAGIGRVRMLYLDPELVGTGIGHRLLTDAHDRLRAAGAQTGQLWVLDGNARAIGFYARHGWELTGRIKDVPVTGGVLREREMRHRTLEV